MTPKTVPGRDLAAWISTCIEEFATSEENRLDESTLEPAWRDPLSDSLVATIHSTGGSRTT